MKISVLTPTYKSLKYLKETLDSLFAQDYKNFEVIICNDSSQDENELKRFLKDNYQEFSNQIIFEQNEKNLGYSLNIRKCFEKSTGEIIYLLAQDDIILSPSHFSELIRIYKNHPNVGFTSRPYFWFDNNIDKKLRRTPKSDKKIIKNNDSREYIDILISSIGQLSGLSFKRFKEVEYFFTPFIFTAHVYPFFQNFLISDCYFFPDNVLAIRMSSSQTTFVSSIYSPSPTLTWMILAHEVFKNNEYLRNIIVDNFGKNYLGLVQIKNYGRFRDLIEDINYLVFFRPKNLLNPIFWVFIFGVLLIPRKILIKLVEIYKEKINSRIIS